MFFPVAQLSAFSVVNGATVADSQLILMPVNVPSFRPVSRLLLRGGRGLAVSSSLRKVRIKSTRIINVLKSFFSTPSTTRLSRSLSPITLAPFLGMVKSLNNYQGFSCNSNSDLDNQQTEDYVDKSRVAVDY